ncbi:RecF/RecN/SMC [Phakopsora pachyrhizi]|nr:RecF/RecN/SMC [Phakopsora pachyrhizi]
MHIESLTIQGFKSYRDPTTVESFSPGVNVIVGRNGSGKSNFFSAIRFLLNDQYNSLGREERQSLLHEGSDNNSTFSAYVEAIFENSDQRFPTGKDRVIIRRTIGSKKDEYSLDKKSIPKGEIMSLLESAGFSKSNPYYIVPQGRITHLTNVKDSERLDLLKEVAGTQVYEDRRAESMKIMSETAAKKIKIDELLEYIETRLKELEEEKQELKEYDQHDRERRCLQYGIFTREMNEINECLEKLESDKQEEISESNVRLERYQARQLQIASLENQLSTAKQDLLALYAEKTQIEEDRREYIKAKTQTECLLRDSEDSRGKDENRRSKLEAELATLQREIKSTEKDLELLRPKHEAKEKEHELIRNRLTELEAIVTSLYEKQVRSNQFRTQKERDQHLRAELERLRELVSSRGETLKRLISDEHEIKENLDSLVKSSDEIRQNLDHHKDWIHSTSAELMKLKAENHDLSERRKLLWKDDTRVSQLVQNASAAKEKAIKDLRVTMDRNTAQGLELIQMIMARGDVPGIYGPLYELIEVDDRYKIAAESTAGNSLFHVVVDSDETAQKILAILANEKRGRCTFIPLNRLRTKNVVYPTGNEAIPIIKKIRFDEKYRLAFEQVFSKTVICSNLDLAGAYVRSHRLNAMTLDGDKVDKKGAVSGGYQEARRSRLDFVREMKTWTQRLDEESNRSRDIKSTIRQLDQQITTLIGKIKNLESEVERKLGDRASCLSSISSLQKDQDSLKTRLAKLEKLRQNQELDLKSLNTQIDLHEKELGSKMLNTLSEEESNNLSAFTTEMESLKTKMLEVTKSKVEVIIDKKNLLEIELKEKLYRKLDEVNSKIEGLNENYSTSQPSSNEIELRRKELATFDGSIEECSSQLNSLVKEIELLKSNVQKNEQSLEKLSSEHAEDGRETSKQSKTVERYWAKKQLLLSRRDECNNNIRILGVLPEEAFEKYVRQRTDKSVKALNKVNETLKKYAHVNKKAIEQYQSFTEQRDKLMERREEMEKSAESITELIEVLDQRKDEAIERTFKQVSRNFSEVFEKLVPLGRGRLIMQKRLDDKNPEDNESEDDEVRPAGTISQYTGVSIKVSFNSKVDEGLRIQQLSGGQKSLVALATIFAIQKCDPAPFYLFDEIDANLDPDRRTSVAAMIGELGKEAQMICTTFRPEMLEHADQFLGVIFNNRKISTIKLIEKVHAKQFVESFENERAPTQAAAA